MTERYSPFSKALDEVQASDLAQLKNVREGWYVEYKSQLPTPTSISKSIAAFANTYGGFLFIGVVEEVRDNPVAGGFPGISSEELSASLERIRQATSAYLSPVPHFDIKVVSGPCEEVGLGVGQSVICIEIPWSPKAPHVHKSGMIFRRVADSSEPKPESDRFILDELFKRSDKQLDRLKRLYESDPVFNENDGKRPYIRLLMCTDPWRQNKPWLESSLPKFRELLDAQNGKGIHLPFDTIYTTKRGIAARQVKGNNPLDLSMTWFIDRDLTAEFLFPLPYYYAEEPEDLYDMLLGYQHADKFIAALEAQEFRGLYVLDLNQLLFVMMGVFGTYHRLLAEAGWLSEYFVLPKILNTHKCVPFLDIEELVDAFASGGVPVFFKFCAEDFDFYHPRRYENHSVLDGNGDDLSEVNASSVLSSIAHDLGISMDDHFRNTKGFWLELNNAAQRGCENQRLRNEAIVKG